MSNLKRWIAYNNWEKNGSVLINSGAEEALCSLETITSLLPIGIIYIKGDFEKGDIIRIENEEGKSIGLGIAQYNSKKAKANIGKKGKKPLVHYDYLYID